MFCPAPAIAINHYFHYWTLLFISFIPAPFIELLYWILGISLTANSTYVFIFIACKVMTHPIDRYTSLCRLFDNVCREIQAPLCGHWATADQINCGGRRWGKFNFMILNIFTRGLSSSSASPRQDTNGGNFCFL